MTRQLAKPNRMKLTQLAVERLPAPAERYVITWDTVLPSFGVRVSSKSRKSWVVKYRVSGKEVEETLGTTLVIPLLSEARKRARASMDTAHGGINPVRERKLKLVAEQAAAAEAAYTLDKLIEDFIIKQHRQSRPATIYECRRLCKRALPYIGGMPVKQIEKKHILMMMGDLASSRQNVWRGDTGPALAEASGVLRHLRSALRWAVDEDLITVDPTQGVRDPRGKNGKHERERVLSEAEIKALWQICDDDLKFPFGSIVKLLLLTGQREREIGDMVWRELDLEKRTLSLPSSRTKNRRPHIVHLSDLTIEIVKGLPRFADGGAGFVFSLDGRQPVSSYSDAKRRIDARMAELLGDDVEPWVIHDLRRTCATGMADLNIAPHVLDRVLNHVTGSLSSIARIYNRSQYLDERKAALDAWGRKLETLLGRDPGNVVVPLRA